MHQLIVLNHIGVTTDTIVQINHLLHYTPVFCFEGHPNHTLCWLCCAYSVGLHNKILICGFFAIHRRVTWTSCKDNHS